VLIEVVPNVSEGRDGARVGRLAARLGPALLDVHCDPDHNRSVLTAAGTADAIEEAVASLAAGCIAEIDLRRHHGAHPRVGALDVVALVALDDGAAGMVHEVAARITRRLAALGLGVYRYGDGARPLPEVRRLAATGAPPDVGTWHPTAGAVCVGVRPLLVAFNVDLEAGTPLGTARHIAAAVRGPSVRALAFDLERQRRVQVSMNLIAPAVVGIEAAYRAVEAAAHAVGTAPAGAEIVGLVPRAALAGLSAEVAAMTAAATKVLEDRVRTETAGGTTGGATAPAGPTP
jgi:glutamate formiminotransferase